MNIKALPEPSNDSLPKAKGPKLNPFFNPSRPSDRRAEFLRLLGGGGHGHVFEVIIDSRKYALKIFKFYNPLEHQHLSPLGIPSDEITLQADPFYAECRAFGGLNGRGLGGDVAVHCYGYMRLPIELEGTIAKRFQVEDWDRPPQLESEPFRAIVKELVLGVPSFTSEMVEKMRADLGRLKDIDVYPIDIKKGNYMGGRLTDFSASWTDPHAMLTFKGYRAYASRLQKGLFDEMIRGTTSTADAPLKYRLIIFAQEVPSTTALGSARG